MTPLGRYTLGAMCAVQLYNAARADLPSLDHDISNGRFDALLTWLRCKVHAIGSLHATADQVMVAATGKAIDPKEFARSAHRHEISRVARRSLAARGDRILRRIRYIKNKYSLIYEV